MATVPVEQIEAYDLPAEVQPGPGNDPYAPVNFDGSPSVLVTNGADGGLYNGITFHADQASGYDNATLSYHSIAVGNDIYGEGVSPAYGYVTNVYDIWAGQFLGPSASQPDSSVLKPQGEIDATGPLPGSFVGGSKIINNSYVAGENNTSSGQTNVSAYEDDDRRLDYMINQGDVVWVAAAVLNGSGFTQNEYLSWSNFNGLAVSGVQDSQQYFSPVGSPGRQHADLSIPAMDASFATGTVSGYAAALWGIAQSDSLTDGQHGIVITSLLMAGADKFTYTRPTNTSSGALDPINGAGQPDYDTSLAILQSGEKTALKVSNNAVTTTSASVGTTQQGWAYTNISSGTQSVVLFQSNNSIQAIDASLNWNVTSPTANNGTELNTTSVIFPNLTLEVRPVTYNASNSTYTLGASESDPTLHSAVVNDNVQYIYSTNGLPAGTYAFLITGDPSLSAQVAFSYTFQGVFTSTWKNTAGGSWQTASNWTNGIPNGEAAEVTLGSSITSAATINLNGDVALGQLTFNSSNAYTIAQGTGGTLRIDETGDPGYNPVITVLAGNHVISAPVHFDYLLSTNISSGASLTISGVLTGNPVLTKNGAGTLILNNADSYGPTNISAGTVSLGSAGSLSGLVTVLSTGTFNFAANTNTGFLVRNQQVTLNAGSTLTLSATSASSNRQLLISSGLTLPGTTGNWTAKVDLSNNDLDIPGASLATTINQIQEGYNGGKWNGAGGILSSSAAANTAHLTALGVIQNNQSGTALFTASNPFDGTTPGVSDILVKYTYYGDANLNGTVDGSDYSLIDNGFLNHLTGWYNGDFNYDGVVNGSDYTLIDNSYNRQGASLAAAVETSQVATTAAVPEPANFALVCIAGMGAIARRRRHRS